MVPRLDTGFVKRRLIRKKNRQKSRALKERICPLCQGTNKDGTRCKNKASCLQGCRRFCKRHAYYASNSKCIDEIDDMDYLLTRSHPYVRDNWVPVGGTCMVYTINNLLRANAVTPAEMKEFERRSHVHLKAGDEITREGFVNDVLYEFMYHLGLRLYLIESEDVDDKHVRRVIQFRNVMENMEKFMRDTDQNPDLTFIGFFQCILFCTGGHARAIRFNDDRSEFLIYDNMLPKPEPVNLDTFYFTRGKTVTENLVIGIALPNDILPLRKASKYNPYTHVPKGRKTPLKPTSRIRDMFTPWKNVDGTTHAFTEE